MSQCERVNTATDHGCFGCGDQNPIGLKLRFYRDGDNVRAEFTPRPEHEGYTKMVHGGVVATLLDEAMSWAVIDAGRLAVTARMNVEYRRPVPVGERLIVIGKVERDRRRIVETSGELRSEAGDLLATSSGTFVRVSDDQQRTWEARYLSGDEA